MYLPSYIQTALQILKEHGASGRAVGGCVRDALLGRPVNDYDLAADIPAEAVRACFAGYKVIDVGPKHGTVNVVIDGHNVEITGLRAQAPTLTDDLAHRDFTVNAMAYSPETGLTDLFGGQDDLRNRVIRCVGDPDERFAEDALRVLRALRFASVLDFELEAATAEAVRRNAPLLRSVPAERIFAELKKLSTGDAARRVLLCSREVMECCIPALAALAPEAYADAAEAAGTLREPALFFAALLRPLGTQAAEAACRALKTDNRFRKDVLAAVSAFGV